MVKLKKKRLSPKEAANQIQQVFADSEGISLKEFKKRRKIRHASEIEYAKTHWVSDLTHAQKYFIATTQDKEPYSYMGRNLSRSNTWQLNQFKQHNKNYLTFIKTKKTIEHFTKPLEPLKKLQQEYQDIGRKLRMGLPNLNPFDVSNKIPIQSGLIQVKGLLHDYREEDKVEKSNGLNTLMKKHGIATV